MSGSAPAVAGHVAAGFEAVAGELERGFRERGDDRARRLLAALHGALG